MSMIDDGSREVQQADDDERYEPVGESAEEVLKGKLAAAILGLQPAMMPAAKTGARTVVARLPSKGMNESAIMIATKTTTIPIHNQGMPRTTANPRSTT